jgi:hypothetical protein
MNSRSSQNRSSGGSLDLNKVSTTARENTPTPLMKKPLLNMTPNNRLIADFVAKHEI